MSCVCETPVVEALVRRRGYSGDWTQERMCAACGESFAHRPLLPISPEAHPRRPNAAARAARRAKRRAARQARGNARGSARLPRLPRPPLNGERLLGLGVGGVIRIPRVLGTTACTGPAG